MSKVDVLILKELRKQMKMTQNDVATALSIGRTSYTKIENGIQDIDTETILKLANIFHVSVDYLLGRKETTPSFPFLTPIHETRPVPIIGRVKCGEGGIAYEEHLGFVYVDEDAMHGELFAFICRGDSMINAGISDGDVAIVRKQEDVDSGELAVVVIDGEEGTLKRIRKFENGVILEPANDAYAPRVFTNGDLHTVHIVGKVLEVRRKFA